MKIVNAKELLGKYQQGLCTDEEKALVETWYLKHHVKGHAQLSPDVQLADIYKTWAVLTERTSPEIQKEQKVHNPISLRKLWYRMVAAAAIVLIFGTLAVIFNRRDNGVHYIGFNTAHDIPAGSNRAVLTLANGKKINLTGVMKGKLAEEAGVSITKTADGKVIYELAPHPRVASGSAQPHNNVASYNTISTPRGGQYQINLPDGSSVWLNAASSLKFPVTFADLKERRVELSGEAYFQVAKDKLKPFRVYSGNQRVEVLGTHFNINAYTGEPSIKTTLLEGRVSVTAASGQDKIKEAILAPGQQSTFINNENIQISPVNAEEVVSWKNGDFVFNDEPLQSIMRKVSRWYDVEVIYAPDAPLGLQLGGYVSRSKPVSVVLERMERTGKVRFEIDGKKITVLPYK